MRIKLSIRHLDVTFCMDTDYNTSKPFHGYASVDAAISGATGFAGCHVWSTVFNYLFKHTLLL